MNDFLIPIVIGCIIVAAIFLAARRIRDARLRAAATGGAVFASPIVMGLAVIVPIFLLYLLLDWLGVVAGGIGRLLMAIIA